jgi:hypothetical protein
MVKNFLILVFLLINLNLFSQISQDNLIDFGVGYGTSTLTFLICEKKEYKHPVIISFCTGTVLGLTKSLYDNYVLGRNFGAINLLATSLGSATACLVLKIQIKEKIKFTLL